MDEQEDHIIQFRLQMKDQNIKNIALKLIDYQLLNEDKQKQQENIQINFEEVLDEIENLEFQLDKAEMQHYVRERDKQYQEKRLELIDLEIKKLTNQIKQLEMECKLEVQKRIFKQDYEYMAKKIVSLDNKEELINKITKIEQETQQLKQQREQESFNIELKQKQLLVLLQSIEQLTHPINH